MNNAWIQSQLTPQEPGFWLVLSLVSLPVVLIAARRLSRRRQNWLYAARWVLIPYLGLMAGGLSPRLMGIAKIDWAQTLSLGVGLLFGLILLIIIVRIFVVGNRRADDEQDRQLFGESRSGWAAAGLTILMTGAEQFHWSFVRGAIWELLLLWPQPLNGVPAYRAIWIATLLTLPELWLQPISVPKRLIKSALLVLTAIVFFYTRNFWLAWLVHTIGWFLLTQPLPNAAGNASALSKNG